MLALLMVYNVLVSHKVLSLHVSFFVVYISLHCVHCSFKHISLTFNECSGFLYFHSAFFLRVSPNMYLNWSSSGS